MSANNKSFLGLCFTETDIDSFSEKILSSNYRGKVIVTPNVDHVIRYNTDRSFRDEYSKADIYVNDSRILRLLSKIFKDPLINLIPGSNLTRFIIETCPRDLSMTVIGCSDSTIEFVRHTYGLKNLAHYNPPMGFINDNEEIEKCFQYCLSNPADIVFLAVGSPQQEILANYLKKGGCNSTFLCIGASFLFISGEEKRAPLWMQKMSMEWFYRLIQNPRRMYKRYLIEGAKILPIIISAKKAELKKTEE